MAVLAQAVDLVEVVRSETCDGEASISPELANFWGDFFGINSNYLDARLFGELDDVFWRPVRVLIKGVNDGFPGVEFHDGF